MGERRLRAEAGSKRCFDKLSTNGDKRGVNGSMRREGGFQTCPYEAAT